MSDTAFLLLYTASKLYRSNDGGLTPKISDAHRFASVAEASRTWRLDGAALREVGRSAEHATIVEVVGDRLGNFHAVETKRPGAGTRRLSLFKALDETEPSGIRAIVDAWRFYVVLP